MSDEGQPLILQFFSFFQRVVVINKDLLTRKYHDPKINLIIV